MGDAARARLMRVVQAVSAAGERLYASSLAEVTFQPFRLKTRMGTGCWADGFPEIDVLYARQVRHPHLNHPT